MLKLFLIRPLQLSLTIITARENNSEHFSAKLKKSLILSFPYLISSSAGWEHDYDGERVRERGWGGGGGRGGRGGRGGGMTRGRGCEMLSQNFFPLSGQRKDLGQIR